MKESCIFWALDMIQECKKVRREGWDEDLYVLAEYIDDNKDKVNTYLRKISDETFKVKWMMCQEDFGEMDWCLIE